MINDIYNRKILAFAADIPLLQRLAHPDATAVAHSRLCGSKVTVDLNMRDGVVTEFGHDVKACALGQASSSIMARHVVGSTPEELHSVRDQMYRMLKEDGPAPTGKWQDLEALLPVKDFKARHASTLLTFDAVVDAVDQSRRGAKRQSMAEKPPAALWANEIAPRVGSNYPPDLAKAVAGRPKRVLGDKFGLTQFGVNHVTLEAGAASSHRHWHEVEDEFIYVLDGEIILQDEAGEHVLKPGMCAGFKAGVANGHRLVNRSEHPATYLEIGTRSPNERATYPDADLKAEKQNFKWAFTRKDGASL